MIEKEIAEIRKRMDATTPGDWWQGLYNFDGSNEMILVNHGDEMQAVAATTRLTYPVRNGWDTERSWENAYFIAHAKGYIETLLAELEGKGSPVCQWIMHCSRAPEFGVVYQDTELHICGRCARGYGLSDGDCWSLQAEDDED